MPPILFVTMLQFAASVSMWISTNWYPILFCVNWLWRYVRLFVNFGSYVCYQSKPIPEKPSYTSEDVTVILPTIENNFEELREPVKSILACNPYELIFVTTAEKYDKLVAMTSTLNAPNVRVDQVAIANKRLQVCESIPSVRTDITIMIDDDVTWPSTIMKWLLAPFEDPKMGAVGVCQRVKRVGWKNPTERMWNFLGSCYIQRRNFEIAATHGLDGGTSCMSGRTCAVRSEILRDPLFLEGFKTEKWGNYILNADDDNFVTRYLVNRNWKTWIQYNKECEIETTLENNFKFLSQCLRWSRSNWRSNYTSLFTERKVIMDQPWCTYALHMQTFTALAFLFDPLIFWLLFKTTESWTPESRKWALIAQACVLLFSKVVKIFVLFVRHPTDLILLPVSILFGYFHGLIKIRAGCTLSVTNWGSREDGGKGMVPSPRRSESITDPLPSAEVLVRFRPASMAEKTSSNRRFTSAATKEIKCTGIRRPCPVEKDMPIIGLSTQNDDWDSSPESGAITPPPVYENSPAYEETCSRARGNSPPHHNE